MTDTKAERLTAALDDFSRAAPNLQGAAVVSFDGLVMAAAVPHGMDEDRLGAMSAALLALGEQAALGLGRGPMHQLFVEGEDGYVFLMSARGEAVLTAVVDHGAKIGLVLYEMRRAADAVGAVLERPIPDDDRFLDGLAAAAEAAVTPSASPATPAWT